MRRLMGALAYAYDAAELYYGRLCASALAHKLPAPGATAPYLGWTPENRLRLVVDAWACIDHLARMEKLVLRFPYGDPRPPEVIEFLDKIVPARRIRNRIQHLDEDIFEGKNCNSGNPVLGAVSWTDGRFPLGHAQYSVSSGPTIDAGTAASWQVTPPKIPNTVSDFRLLAADQHVSIDDLVAAARSFVPVFERRLTSFVHGKILAWAGATGISVWATGKYWPCDMVGAIRFLPAEEGRFKVGQQECAFHVEVPPGTMIPPLPNTGIATGSVVNLPHICKAVFFFRAYSNPWWSVCSLT